jgi:hypothetical protein
MVKLKWIRTKPGSQNNKLNELIAFELQSLDRVLLDETRSWTLNETDEAEDVVDQLDPTAIANQLLAARNFLKIRSITTHAKLKNALVVRFFTKEDRQNNYQEAIDYLEKRFNGLEFSTKMFHVSRWPATEINDSKGNFVRLIYKYDQKTREGLAFEHILAFVLTGKSTKKLKRQLDISINASDVDVEQRLTNLKWKKLVEKAFIAGDVLEKQFDGPIHKAVPVGGAGTKADLILTTAKNEKIAISVKWSRSRSKNIFYFNKDLGDGTEEGSLIPNDEPWWVTARKNILFLLQKKGIVQQDLVYNPSRTDYSPPDWLILAQKDVDGQGNLLYNQGIRSTFSTIRHLLVQSLQNKDLFWLASLVREAHIGLPRESDTELYKLIVTTNSVNLEKVLPGEPDIAKIEAENLSSKDFVKYSGSTLNINIPGMLPTSIHGIKFRDSLISGTKSKLQIKTR